MNIDMNKSPLTAGTVAQIQLDTADQVLAHTYERLDCMFTDGKGAELRTAGGKSYLDMTSGIGVLALGHNSDVVQHAIEEAAGGLVHVSNLYHTAAPVMLAKGLVECSFADRVFFCNSGAEAVEGAIKFARLAGGERRSTIVYFSGSFHGRTLGALAATDRPAYREPFEPLAQGFIRAPFNDEDGLAAIDDSVAAVLVEPIQGESGVHVAQDDWLRALRARCNATGALLIFDEVQCGLGRTGHLWAHEWPRVQPDLMTLAKPLAGGLPIGAVLMRENVADAIRPGCHGTTFGGGPLVTRVGLRVLQRIQEPGFLDEVRHKGEMLRRMLARLDSPLVHEIRGRGLMIGIQVDVSSADIVRCAAEVGLLILPAGDDVIRLLPPLNVTKDELGRAVLLLHEALDTAESELDR